MLGRLTADQMDHFRREVDGKGLSSYPHPWLMPDFWQFPTVSMGLGPIMAIYQARFMKYLHDRGIANTENRKVWCFVGDGEVDEPETLGAIGLAARENLDNLIFVINCNLQRLDGPVRGNGKIIQELEATFRGAGWNVLKVIWGSYWDPLLARDRLGLLRQRMDECVDGDYQTFKARDGAYVREHFFGKYPELKELVASWSDDDIWRLNRGGHDPHKVYAAYTAAMNHKGQPTVILAKTVKGYGMGEAGEAQNITHQQKKMGTTSLQAFRNRFKLPLTDEQLERLDYIKPDKDSPEHKYMVERRMALGGFVPSRRRKAAALEIPALSILTRCSRPRPRAASFRPPWRSCVCSACCSRTNSSASTWCRSWPTNRAPSAWRACSARSASGRRSASCTRRRIATSSCSTKKTRTARFCKRALTRPAPCARGSRRQRRIRRTVCR